MTLRDLPRIRAILILIALSVTGLGATAARGTGDPPPDALAETSGSAAFREGVERFREHRYQAAEKIFEQLRRSHPDWRPRECESWRLASALRAAAEDRADPSRWETLLRESEIFVRGEGAPSPARKGSGMPVPSIRPSSVIDRPAARVATAVVAGMGREGKGTWFFDQALAHWRAQVVSPASVEGYMDLLEAVLLRWGRWKEPDTTLLQIWEELRRAGASPHRLRAAARTLLLTGAIESRASRPQLEPQALAPGAELPPPWAVRERIARDTLSLDPDASLAALCHLVLAETAEWRGLYRQAVEAAWRAMELPPGEGDAPRLARLLLERITAPRIECEAPLLYRPGSGHPVSLRWRNLRGWRLQLRRVDPIADLREKMPERSDRDDTPARFYRDDAGRPVLTRSFVDLREAAARGDSTAAGRAGEAHVPRDSTLILDALPEGLYLLRVEGEVFDAAQRPSAEGGSASAPDGGTASAATVVARRLLQVTHLGLSLSPVGDDAFELWLTRMDDGRAVGGAELLLLRRWKSPEQSEWTTTRQQVKLDRQGRAQVPGNVFEPRRQEVLVVGSKGRAPVFLWTDLYASQPHREEPVSWRGFVLTDRPLYRPGERVHLQAFVRRARLDERSIETPSGLEVEILVRDPSGAELLRESGTLDANGSIESSLSLSRHPPLGSYAVQIRYGPQLVASGNFQVDAYRRPEFTVRLSLPEQRNHVLGDTLQVKVAAAYLFGGAVQGKVEIVVHRRPFRFGWRPQPLLDVSARPLLWPRPGFATQEIDRVRLLLDEKGEALVSIPTHGLAGDPTARFEYTIEARVQDASRREESGRLVVRVGAEELVASLHAHRQVVHPGDSVQVRLEVEDLMQRPAAIEGSWSLVRLRGEDDERRLQGARVETDASGTATIVFAVAEPGRYRVDFSARDGRGRPVRAGTIVWCADPRRRLRVAGTRGLQLITAADAFTGDVAEVLLVSERPDIDVHLTRSFAQRSTCEVVRLVGNARLLRIPLDRFHRPSFSLRATAAWDWTFRGAMVRVTTPWPSRLMHLSVDFDEEDYRPGETAHLRIRALGPDGEGLRTPVTLAVVDDAVLQLRPRVQPDLAAMLQRFPVQPLPREMTSVQTARGFHDTRTQEEGGAAGKDGSVGPAAGLDLAGNVHYKAAGERGESLASAAPTQMDETLPSSWPDAASSEAAAPQAVLRRDFRATALWRTAVMTSADGSAEVECPLPESLTRWKAWALALSPQNRAGTAEAEARTHKSLMVRINEPRIFREGDHFVFVATVHNESATAQRVKLRLEAEGLQVDGESVEVEVPARGQASAEWSAAVPPDAAAETVRRNEDSGRIEVIPRRVEVRIEALAPHASDALLRTVEVHPWGTPLRLVANTRLRDGGSGSLELEMPARRRDDLSRVALQLSPSVLSVCVDALPYLAAFPYGCTEQTLSRFVPAVAVRSVARRMGVETRRLDPRLDEKVAEGLRRIARMQRPDGGWGWWAQDESRPDLTAYALVSLRRAQLSGIEVDERLLRRGSERLRAMLPRLEGQDDDLAWALHALALTGVAEDETMARLATSLLDRRDRLRDWARALTASYLHRVGRDDDGRRMLARLEESAQRDRQYGTVHWGRRHGYWWRGQGAVETTAFALQAFLDLDPHRPEVEGAARWLVANREGNRWDSTRATAHAILTLSDYAGAVGESDPDYTLSAWVAGEELVRIRVSRRNLLDAGGSWPIDPALLETSGGKVEIRMEGHGTAYASLVLDTWTSAAEPAPSANWLSVERSYFRLRPVRTLGGEIVEVEEALAAGDRVTSGERIRVRLLVKAHRDLDYVVVEDPRPAGCEAVESLSGWVSGKGWSGRREVRDDRDAFFIAHLGEGSHRIEYELRAESPGIFRVPPARVEGMYLPDVNGSSRAFRLVLRSEEVER